MLFPGQGAQFLGMGLDAYQRFPMAKAVYDSADSFDPSISTLCFKGPLEELNKTAHTQICIFTTELALVAALKERNIIPDGVAGFSLGEVTGTVVSNILELQEGFELVRKRGQAMGKAACESDTIMIAVLKLKNKEVEMICQNFLNAYPVNYNCPEQLVVSLLQKDELDFLKLVKTTGGRGIPLKVSGGFHSPFMSSATKIFKKNIQNFNFQESSIPLYSNTNAIPYPKEKDDIMDQLIYHINHPVFWEKTIRNMVQDGFDQFIEVGPGKTLSGFMKKIDSSLSCSHVDDLLKDSRNF